MLFCLKVYAPLALCVFLRLLQGSAASSMISNAFVSPVLARDVMTSRQHQNMHYRSIPLSAQTPDGNEKTNTSPSARERGIYARPSAAIEKGSGFFIPGLEGKKECMQKYCTCLLYLYESIQCTSPLDICVPPHRPVNCTLRKQNHISSFRGRLDNAIAMSQSINHPRRHFEVRLMTTGHHTEA